MTKEEHKAKRERLYKKILEIEREINALNQEYALEVMRRNGYEIGDIIQNGEYIVEGCRYEYGYDFRPHLLVRRNNKYDKSIYVRDVVLKEE